MIDHPRERDMRLQVGSPEGETIVPSASESGAACPHRSRRVGASVIEISLLRLRFFLRFFGALIRCRFCRFSFTTAKHPRDGITEQDATGHTQRSLRRASEEASSNGF